jgi:hypothetical protein
VIDVFNVELVIGSACYSDEWEVGQDYSGVEGQIVVVLFSDLVVVEYGAFEDDWFRSESLFEFGSRCGFHEQRHVKLGVVEKGKVLRETRCPHGVN